MKITEGLIAEKRAELESSDPAKRTEWGRQLVIGELALGQPYKAVFIAEQYQILTEIPEKYLRQVARLWATCSNIRRVKIAKLIFEGLGDREAFQRVSDVLLYLNRTQRDDYRPSMIET